ncbi:MAG: phosphoadenosine phosphosulfate reductase family protein [Clostridia bacterium]|nr:phosphoadenosine phosphosulfate reductase family protein [Clostridia bacterium]
MKDIIYEYIEEFISESSLALELDGKHEVRKYAPYWIKDIYSFASKVYFQLHESEEENINWIHRYNPVGKCGIEVIADEIYDNLKKYKVFSYYFEVNHEHLRDLIKQMNYFPQAYYQEDPLVFDEIIGFSNALYNVDDLPPLPLSSYPMFAYSSDDFTPDVLEYEALRNSKSELESVLPVLYGHTDSENFLKNMIEILSKFDIPMERMIEGKTSSDEVELSFYMNGIERQMHVRKLMFTKKFKTSFTGLELIKIISTFLSETSLKLIGLSKERGSSESATYGIYPMKDSTVHGLKLELPKHMSERELELFEAQSVYLIKETLFILGNPVMSTSYGADSVLTHILVNKVYPNIDVYHGKTGLNFPEVYEVERKLLESGIIKREHLHYGKNKESYWNLVDEYGLNFDRKGSRVQNHAGKKISVSEKCCTLLKHLPFKEAINEHHWNINFAGLRADESRARDLAAKRDGPIYYAKSWSLYRVNPIIFWTDEKVWEYTKLKNIPYASIYDMTLTDDQDNVTFKPRVGCWACMLSSKYGYLKWLREYKPKLYSYIMLDKGLLKLLYAKKFGHEIIVNENGKESPESVIEDFDSDFLMGFLEQRPCFFDDTLVRL